MPYTATHPNRGLLNGLIQQHRTNGYDTTFRGKAAFRILNDTTVDDAFIDVWYADAQAAKTDADWEGLRDAIVPPPAQTAPTGECRPFFILFLFSTFSSPLARSAGLLRSSCS